MILQTKLYRPPRRENFLPRPRLIAQLERGRDSKLTLVTAPAGFGKTTLVANWLHEQSHAQGWLALDEWDNDLNQFLSYLRVALGLGETAVSPAILSNTPPTPKTLAHHLLTEIYHLEATCFVLDDYHLITDPNIHQLMTFLLEHLPPQIQVILTTRQDPPFPLARWRVRQQLSEVRAVDLRFTVEEAAHFLSKGMGLTLTPEQVHTLETRTEGWITGLHLAALSLQNQTDHTHERIQAFTGHDRYIMDYLLAEVLQQLGKEKRAFLWQTAVLSRLSAPLCAHITGQTISQAQRSLEQMDQANLFLIPLDNQRQWWRYHHLFADLLRHQWQQNTNQTDRIQTHRQAADWYAERDELDEALHHLRQTNILADELAFIRTHIYRLLGDSRIQMAFNWFRHLPDEAINQDPYLCAAATWTYVLIGDTAKAQQCIEIGEPRLHTFIEVTTANGHTITMQELQGQYTTLKGYITREQGRFSESIEHTKTALKMLPEEALTIRSAAWLNLAMVSIYLSDIPTAEKALEEAINIGQTTQSNLFVAISAIGMMVDIARSQANLREAERRSKHPLLNTITGDVPALAMRSISLALIAYARNQIEEAWQYIEQAEVVAKNTGHLEGMIAAGKAEMAFATGRISEAQKALKFAEEKLVPIMGEDQILTFGWVYSHASDPQKAKDWLKQYQMWQTPPLPSDDQNRLEQYGHSRDHIFLLATLHEQLGQYAEALHLNSWLLEASQQANQQEHQLEEEILQAVLLRKEPNKAIKHLRKALLIGVEAGYRMPFLRYQNELRPLLKQIKETEAQIILAEMELSRNTPAKQPLLDPLTEREEDVLRLLVQGHNSTQIAEQLVLAKSTVRSYIKSIYSKLGVHNRVEAVQKAVQLGL